MSACCRTRCRAISTLPTDHETTFEDYMKTRQYKPLRPGQISYWQNYRKFFVSFQKAIYGDAATRRQRLGL